MVPPLQFPKSNTTMVHLTSRCPRAERDLVRIATFNINNINQRLDNLLAWLAKAEPDVVSFQELKAEQGAFPVNALRTLGYEAGSCVVVERASPYGRVQRAVT